MARFALFGVLPIKFDVSGAWRADTGSEVLNEVFQFIAAGALSFLAGLEAVFGVGIDIRLVPLDEEHPGIPA